jgi:DNA-binding transcriptional LysR family regulator
MTLAIHDLELFLAACESGQFAAAATDMGTSYAALAKSVRRLEGELGLRLFDRVAGGMRLTAFGVAFAERARRICSNHDDMLRYAGDMRAGHAGLFRVGATMSTVEVLVAPALAKLQALRPKMQVNVFTATSQVLLDHLQEGRIDVVVIPDGDPTRQGLNKVVVGHDRLVPVVRAQHPLMEHPRLELAALAPYSWILPAGRHAMLHRLRSAFIEAGLALPRAAIEAQGGPRWALPIVLRTDLIAYASFFSIEQAVPHAVRILPLHALEFAFDISALSRPGAYWSPLLGEFLEMLSSARPRGG